MDFIDSIKKTKEDSFILASLPEEIRNDALERMTKALQANKEAIFEANARDLELAKEAGLPAPIANRLVFDSHKMKSCIDGIYDLIYMEDPLFQDLLKRELDTDLILTKTTCLSVSSVSSLNQDRMHWYRSQHFASKAATAPS